MRLAAALALLAFHGLASAADVTLEAGVAKIDITPGLNGPMWGYANRKCGPATGTHDPLFAKALVLRTGDSRIAIVTLDLCSIVPENLHREVADKLGIPVLESLACPLRNRPQDPTDYRGKPLPVCGVCGQTLPAGLRNRIRISPVPHSAMIHPPCCKRTSDA
jgi:hypothetical protein